MHAHQNTYGPREPLEVAGCFAACRSKHMCVCVRVCVCVCECVCVCQLPKHGLRVHEVMRITRLRCRGKAAQALLTPHVLLSACNPLPPQVCSSISTSLYVCVRACAQSKSQRKQRDGQAGPVYNNEEITSRIKREQLEGAAVHCFGVRVCVLGIVVCTLLCVILQAASGLCVLVCIWSRGMSAWLQTQFASWCV